MAAEEIKECIGKVISPAGMRKAARAPAGKTGGGGVQGGVLDAKKKKAS